MLNIIVLISVCNQNRKRIINQVNNIASQLSKFNSEQVRFEPLFLFGVGGNPENIPFDHLIVDVPEAYTNLYLKLFEAYKHIQQNYAFDYICKIDDDTQINFEMFNPQWLQGSDYVGRFFDGNSDATITLDFDFCNHYKVINLKPEAMQQGYYFASGDCYFLSRKAVDIIVSKGSLIKELPAEGYRINEDRLFGKMLHNEDILKRDINLTNDFTTENDLQVTWEYFTLHPISENVMPLLSAKSPAEQVDTLNKNKTLNLLKRKIYVQQLENRIRETVMKFLNEHRTIGLG
jgi:hypothetical protein